MIRAETTCNDFSYKLSRHAGKIHERSVEADHPEGVTDANEEKQRVGEEGEIHHLFDDLHHPSLCVNLHNLLVSLLCYSRQSQVTVDQTAPGEEKNILKIFCKSQQCSQCSLYLWMLTKLCLLDLNPECIEM